MGRIHQGHGDDRPTLSHGDTRVENCPPSAAATGCPRRAGSPPGCPHGAHLRGRLTRKVKATMSRKLKTLSLYSSSPTRFSQHWCGMARHHHGPCPHPGPQPPLTHRWVGGLCR